MIKNEQHANVCTLKPGAASHKVLNTINCIYYTYLQEQKYNDQTAISASAVLSGRPEALKRNTMIIKGMVLLCAILHFNVL